MSIRIRRQYLPQTPEKRRTRHSVEIISVDQFTLQARKLEKQHTEREHLLRLLNTQLWEGDHMEQFYRVGDYLFWLEKK